MKKIKFESVERPDGLREEAMFEKGDKEYPLRRAVGMPMFESEAEKTAYLEAAKLKEGNTIEERQEWERLRTELEEGLQKLWKDMRGDPGIGKAVMTLVRSKPLLRNSKITLMIAHDYNRFSLTIPSEANGSMNFIFSDKSK